MRILPASIACLMLTGCGQQISRPDGQPHHGRYAGIGVFSPSGLWSRMAIGDPPKDSAAATTADDDMIIVVIDSDTGEVRECGDYSGRCVSMNPWSKAIAKNQLAPVALTKHAAEIADDQTSPGKVKMTRSAQQ